MGSRWLPPAAVTVLAAGLAWLNRGERVALDVGIATFYRAPLTMVLFLAFLAGMLSMLWLGLRQDRRMREELRARGLLDVPARSAGPAWARPQETAAHADAAHPPAASAWAQADETVVRSDGAHPPEGHPRAAFDGSHADETVARADRQPEDRTVIYPRYDEDPAA